MPGTGTHEAGGIWGAEFSEQQAVCGMCHVAGGRQRMLAEIMTSVNIIF